MIKTNTKNQYLKLVTTCWEYNFLWFSWN